MTKLWPKRNLLDKAVGPVTAGSLRSGLAGGLLAGLFLCPPALAVVLGLGGAAFLAPLEAHQTAFRLVAGLGLTLAAAWWSARRWTKGGGGDRHRIPFLLPAVGSFGVAYLALDYVVTTFGHDLYHAVSAPR